MIEYVDTCTVRLYRAAASDKDVAYAAWVSNFGNDAEERDTSDLTRLIHFLYKNRHMSPFEHGQFTFFVDCPIFVAREFMRHRTFSYNETSGRYKELDPRMYRPPAERPLVQKGRVGAYRFEEGAGELYATLLEETDAAYEAAWYAYQTQLKAGIAKEVARNVLPVATMTQFYATVNPRNLMAFLNLRNDPNAQYEIREVSKKMEAIFAEAMPLTYDAYKAYDWREAASRIEELEAEIKELKSKHFEEVA